MWWDADRGFLHLRGQFAAVDGAIVETTLNDLVEAFRPAPDGSGVGRDQRTADVLVGLCRNAGERDPDTACDAATPALLARRPLFVVEVPRTGPAEICGVPLPDTVVEHLRAQARIEPVLVDGHDVPVARGRVFRALSPNTVRAVLARDGHCRCGTCDRRHGLQIHHLWPRSWGGTDHVSNLAAVCVGGGTDHHPVLVPHGPWLLVGDPHQPDGLRLVHRDHVPGSLAAAIRARRPPTLTELGLDRPDAPDARAGPDDP